jgi:hypothetical protein
MALRCAETLRRAIAYNAAPTPTSVTTVRIWIGV